MKLKLLISIALLIVMITSAFSCRLTSPEVREKLKPVKLTWWRPWDSTADVSDLINGYQALHPHVAISYKKFRYEEYEQALLNGWAADEGPDIFSLNNNWVRQYQNNIALPPETTAVPRTIVTGPTFKQTRKVVIQTLKFPNANDIKSLFIPPVYSDVIDTFQVLALPIAADTLVLYYNRDLLNKAGLPQPPKTWLEFKDAIKKLTLLDDNDQIVQAGAGLGSAKNVARYTDILALLMLQNGTDMTAISQALNSEKNYYPGLTALNFYVSFADPTKETYTWNLQMPDSLETFINGQSAFFFGYSYDLRNIQASNPKLNFDIAPMLQISTNQNLAANLANYWVESVSKKTANPEVAWDFLLFASTQKDPLRQYLDKARKPTALRALIIEQEKDYDLKPFVSQLLTSKSWYQGKNFNLVETIFAEMIDSVVTGLVPTQDSLNRAAEKLKKTY